jgi:hypothetical protein
MDLIKQLMGSEFAKSAQVDESLSDNTAGRVRTFKRSFNIIEESLEKLDLYLSEHSQFSQNVGKLGGDEAYMRDAREQLATLQQTLSELHMSVGMANGEHWDTN